MFPAFGLSLIFAIALCVHVVRTGQPMFWLWIILLLQPLGGLVYVVAVIGPDLLGGRTARRLGSVARETLDPNREYREAKVACDDAPTVRNQSRLAAAAADLGRFDEAEALFGAAAQGMYADDPVLLLGRANALLELDRHADALELLDQLGRTGSVRTPGVSLSLGRAYEALGRTSEAQGAYEDAAARLPGLEGLARQAAFLVHTGRRDAAAEIVGELDRRVAKSNPQFRKEARAWRDFAAAALTQG